jgi:hypothetical protein
VVTRAHRQIGAGQLEHRRDLDLSMISDES